LAAELGLVLIGTGIGLGMRHGVDWDHIAAISDVTSTHESKRRALAMGTLYAIGHAAVVIVLGFAAIWFGALLPEAADTYLESIVGLTLIGLGGWILLTMWQTRGDLVLKSRWMLVFDGVRYIYGRLTRTKEQSQPQQQGPTRGYGPAASTGIGMIHGIGAETGSQALLLAAAAGATSVAAGSFLLIAFAVGLVVSNTLIALASVFGFIGAGTRKWTHIILGLTVAGFSLVVGFMFLFQNGDFLPGLLA
jgi:cytochrome c biogenesis protein CcdA